MNISPQRTLFPTDVVASIPSSLRATNCFDISSKDNSFRKLKRRREKKRNHFLFAWVSAFVPRGFTARPSRSRLDLL